MLVSIGCNYLDHVFMCTTLEITPPFKDSKLFNTLISYKKREWNAFLDKHIVEAEKVKNLVVLEMTILFKGDN